MGNELTWQIGDVTITSVPEIAMAGFGSWLLPDATPEVVARHGWLDDFVDSDGELLGMVQSFAIDAGGTKVLVDTGLGNDKSIPRPEWNDLHTPFLDDLTATGFAPRDVDIVFMTHLHMDHMGWNTRLDGDTWVPTFTEARYLTARPEYDYWTTTELPPERRIMYTQSIDPVYDAGLLDLIDVAERHEIAPGVFIIPTPGHTPGHSSILVESQGAKAIITGDCMHHPVQIADIGICAGVDFDPQEAVRTRQKLLDELDGTDALLIGSHFARPTAGRINGNTLVTEA